MKIMNYNLICILLLFITQQQVFCSKQNEALLLFYNNINFYIKCLQNSKYNESDSTKRQICHFKDSAFLYSISKKPFSDWVIEQQKIITVFFDMCNSVLANSCVTNSFYINDTVTVIILASCLTDTTFKLNLDSLKYNQIIKNPSYKIRVQAYNLLLMNTSYPILKKMSAVIKPRIDSFKLCVFPEDKETAIKLMALLELTDEEKKNLLKETLITPIMLEILRRQSTNGMIDVSDSLKLYSNLKHKLSLSIKARLGDVTAEDSLINMYMKKEAIWSIYDSVYDAKLKRKVIKEQVYAGTGRRLTGDSLYNYDQQKLIAHELNYIGSEKCIKTLIIHFNKPVFLFCGKRIEESIRWPIMKSFRYYYPESVFFNKKLSVINIFDSTNIISLLNEFKEWAEKKYKVKPIDKDPRPVLFTWGCDNIDFNKE